MRGITPVIAIILLLLIAIASVLGAYFTYRNFARAGEDAGARQIDQFTERVAASVMIESAAAGRIYIRNTGTSSINLDETALYIDDTSYDFTPSVVRLDSGRMAELLLNEAPTCPVTGCKVRIGGAAFAETHFSLSEIICSVDGDCRPGETCDGGICTS